MSNVDQGIMNIEVYEIRKTLSFVIRYSDRRYSTANIIEESSTIVQYLAHYGAKVVF